MRIAIATDWFAPRQGGIEAQLVALAERLSRRGHEVTVITSTPGAGQHSGYAVRSIAGPRIPGTAVIASPALLRVVRRAIEGFDVVHAHVSVVSPLAYGAAFVAASQQVPAVVTFHSVLRLKRIALALVNAVARLDRTRVVWTAVSQLVAAQVGGALGTVVAVLPNGIDLKFWSGARGNGRRASDIMTFASAMRMHPKKRPRPLLHAFGRAVADARSPARLVLAGAGPELDALRSEAKRIDASTGASVEFRDWLDGAALRTLYRESDAFVLPTKHEAFGIAALEARVAGLPVIASSDAGCREFLRHDETALLCATDADFAEAMTRMIRDATLRQRLGNADDALDLARYDWDRVLDDHERAYLAAITRASGAAVSSVVPA
ncbi:MAG: glycosyltransferase family 4 protein [Gemmatimonadaceae bacterium]